MDSTVGALIGLLVSIFLIIKKVSPAYSLILGALIGGLAGGFSLEQVVESMTEGVKDVSSAVLRILTAGVLSGVLIKTGAAMTISNAIRTLSNFASEGIIELDGRRIRMLDEEKLRRISQLG